jgi:hypothetical protein
VLDDGSVHVRCKIAVNGGSCRSRGCTQLDSCFAKAAEAEAALAVSDSCIGQLLYCFAVWCSGSAALLRPLRRLAAVAAASSSVCSLLRRPITQLALMQSALEGLGCSALPQTLNPYLQKAPVHWMLHGLHACCKFGRSVMR